MSEKFEELMDKWHNIDGTKNIIKPPEIEKYFQLNREEINALSLSELDYTMYVVSQYLIFISSICGTAEGYRNFVEDKYDDLLDEEASKLDSKVYKTLKERQSIALQKSDELKKFKDKLAMAKLRYSKIRFLPDAAREFLSVLKRMIDRRIKGYAEKHQG